MEVWDGPGVFWCCRLRLRLAVTLIVSPLSTVFSVCCAVRDPIFRSLKEERRMEGEKVYYC